MTASLVIDGMHGLGDNIHQRAIVRQLMERNDVWLISSWVSVYHDIIADGLKVINRSVRLRTQTKNAQREAALFSRRVPPASEPRRIWYAPAAVKAKGSVLAAMCASVGCDVTTADFRLPIPAAWTQEAENLLWDARALASGRKPLMILRPLHERKEWGGCRTRNANAKHYAELYAAIRERFFVVSVADLEDGEEWLTEPRLEADVCLHKGELTFEAMAALFARAGLVFTSGGFATILAQAVGTPVICVGGGYERCSVSYSTGARFAPTLFIEPRRPCECFRHDCACTKEIDMRRVVTAVEHFARPDQLTRRRAPPPRSPHRFPRRPGLPTITPSALGVKPIDWSGLSRRYMNVGELEALIALVARINPKRVVEIGVNSGRTAKAILANVPGISRYVGIDVERGYVPACKVQRREVPDQPGEMATDDDRFRLVLRPRGSLDLAPHDVWLAAGGVVDAMFIDGDHGAAAVANDTRLAHACVRRGGIAIWHDYHDLGTVDVKDVLDDLAFCGANIVHVEGTWLAYEIRP